MRQVSAKTFIDSKCGQLACCVLACLVLVLTKAPLQSQPVQPPSKYFGPADNGLWRGLAQAGQRKAVLRAVDGSLRYLRTQRAATAYARLGAKGVSRARVRRSLIRFRRLFIAARSTQQLEAALRREFVLYRPASRVHFTGYFQPTYAASQRPNAVYRYPLFRMPPSLARARLQPTRLQLEGADGLHISPLLRGYEIAWLRDRLQAYLVQVEGSAHLQLTDGRTITIGYGGHTNYAYTSMGRELVKDGVMPFEKLTLPALVDYFHAAPQEMNRYLPRNRRFVFFAKRAARPSRAASVCLSRRSIRWLPMPQLCRRALWLWHKSNSPIRLPRVFSVRKPSRAGYWVRMPAAPSKARRASIFSWGRELAPELAPASSIRWANWLICC